MKPLVAILQAHYVGDYKISLLFNDNTTQIVDFEPFLRQAVHPQIRKYLDKRYFCQFVVENGDIQCL